MKTEIETKTENDTETESLDSNKASHSQQQ